MEPTPDATARLAIRRVPLAGLHEDPSNARAHGQENRVVTSRAQWRSRAVPVARSVADGGRVSMGLGRMPRAVHAPSGGAEGGSG